ncbi:hypothetical protein DL770_001594 [Monosporascus sp. CRB-9-2]|nr:hypothetical protein DL770_001594 [Monosporascus sp. CRB-9-2]
MGLSALFKASVLALSLLSGLAGAVPASAIQERQEAASSYWFANIERQGVAAFGSPDHAVFRNVKAFGAKGDGLTDDTEAINRAVQAGPNRCIDHCDSRTNSPAIVYFPPGTYVVSAPIIQSYYTQFVGDAVKVPTIKATADFKGMAVIDANPYYEGGDGLNWYINQNQFFRQIRNFVIDIRDIPMESGAGIHWQVAQATSLQNIVFEMNRDTSPKNVQKGLFIENGSGGFMTDLTFNGGGFGMDIGSQQFTIRNLTFNNCNTAMHMIWNWQFLMQGITINGGKVGIDMTSDTLEIIKVGSLIIQDSKFSNVGVGVSTLYKPTLAMTNNTLILDNVDMREGVTTAVQYAKDQTVILPGNQVVKSFAQGRQYSGTSGKPIQSTQNEITKPKALTSNGKMVTRAKPQYEDVPISNFVSVKAAGAKGDGYTDDTAKIQQIFDNARDGDIIYFDHGAYLITDTVRVPKNIKITGEMWPLLMAAGRKFADESKPIPVFQVGQPGDVGDVEMSDLIIQTKGPAPGAILMEWNLAGSKQASAGLWDVHFRVGGAAGSELQSDKCAKNPNVTTTPDPECFGAFMLLHLTPTASAYIENCWFWVADHELDLTDHNQINLYNGRGVLIESQNPIWLWGTASEHSQLYNYQISNAKNVFMGVIQTETAYMQGNPDATVPFIANAGYLDPDFTTSCDGSSYACARTWGLRVTNSSDVFMYGGGLYSFFDNYEQVCVDEQNCQDNMISIEESSVHLFGITTKASVNMITHNGRTVALDQDNRSTFGATIVKFETSGGPAPGDQTGDGDSGSGSDSGSAPSSSEAATSSAGNATGTAGIGQGSGPGSTETGGSIVPTVTTSGQYAPPDDSVTAFPTAEPIPSSAFSVTNFPTSGASEGDGEIPATTPIPAPTGTQGSGDDELVFVTVTETVTATVTCEMTS